MDNLKESLAATFNGISQVTFLEKPWFGFMIFIGLLFVDVYTAVGVLIASFTSYLISLILYDKNFTTSGLAAFNSVLLVLMVEAFLGGFASLFLVIPATMICMLIQHILKVLLAKINLVPFALPTVFSTYLMLLLDKIWPGMLFTDKLLFKLTVIFDTLNFSVGNHFLLSGGDLYLQASVIFAVILVIGFIIFEKEYIIYLLASYCFSLLVFYLLGFFFNVDPMGFTTFNILLGMMALKAFGLMSMNKYLIIKLFFVTLAVIIVKFALDYLLGLIGLPSIVLPFIVVVDAVLMYKNIKESSKSYGNETV